MGYILIGLDTILIIKYNIFFTVLHYIQYILFIIFCLICCVLRDNFVNYKLSLKRALDFLSCSTLLFPPQ